MKIHVAPKTPEPRQMSWWLEEALSLEPEGKSAPALRGEISADVAIVGGGFAGLWTAVLLAGKSPHLSIVLIESAICGSGASGKNGGMVSGYWARLGAISKLFGDDNALAIARAGTRAQDNIRDFARDCGTDLWWRDGGSLRVATHPDQEVRIEAWLSEARRLGVMDTVTELSPAAAKSLCKSEKFGRTVLFSEGAGVHPARLARTLRRIALSRGVRIFENTPMTALERGAPSRISTPGGQIVARDVVLTMNAGLAQLPEFGSSLCLFSSYVSMTAPIPDLLSACGWTGNNGLTDLQNFIRYARKTPDDRVLGGSGGGPIGYGADFTASCLAEDPTALDRAGRLAGDLIPALAPAHIEKRWGGAVDVASDRLPFFGTLPGTRIHYAAGFTGHGVNATHIAGQCLSSFVLGEKNDWTALALCNRTLPKLPPEPFRYVGAGFVRWGILRCEEAQQHGVAAPTIARIAATLPERLHLRIGTR
ncbi:MAG TPA: FAD-binding oxidoreductase [Paenirhodobacter sp.]